MANLRFWLLAASAFSSTSAHMIMVHPPPFGKVDNSPLLSGGGPSNYPCKATDPSYYNWSNSSSIAQGEQSFVQFQGSAVHGGGSCQFSLTKDKEPTAKSEFKVIHSVEGGCPMRNTPGNAAGGPDTDDPDKYFFTMNPKIDPGEYTFAWTWFNKVGNREMYMNCAPVTVTAGSGKSKTKRDDTNWQTWDQLPSMMVANTNAGPGCDSNQLNYCIKFPDPGNSVETNSDTFIYPSNYCEAPNLKPTNVAASLLPSASSSFKLASGNVASAAGGSGGASSAPAPPPAAAKAAPQQDTQAAPQGPAAAPISSVANVVAPSPAAATPAQGGCIAGQQPCSAADGAIFCFSAASFGTCDKGCAAPLPVANGMQCQDGAMKLAKPVARAMHKRGGHRHRSRQQ